MSDMPPIHLPDLGGPDLYHVYIGYHSNAKDEYKKLVEELDRHKFEIYQNEANQPRKFINEGITSSQKTVLVFTPEYQADSDLCHYEKKQALEKAKYRGSGSLFIILCGLKREELDKRFLGYNILLYDDSLIFNDLSCLLSQVDSPDPSTKTKVGMGYTLASSYYYGYLRCILPGLATRLKESEMMTEKDETVMSDKLFIIIPKTCFCPVKMETGCDIFGDAGPKSLLYNASHAGSEARDYKSNIYTIHIKDRTNQKTSKMLRVVVEYASSVAILHDMMKEHVMSEDEALRELNIFYFYLKCYLKKGDLANRVQLIYYNARDSLGDLLLSAVNTQMLAEKNNYHVPTSTAPPESFIVEENSHLNVIHEKRILAHYPLEKKPRGTAYIINIKNFIKLEKRQGSDKDVECMDKLFHDLGFEVDTQTDLNSKKLEEWSSALQTKDFTDAQAIVICIMSHGIHGQFYCKDDVLIPILRITEDLNCNDTLKGKPKLFFIQACQRGTIETKDDQPSRKQNTDEFGVTPHGTDNVPKLANKIPIPVSAAGGQGDEGDNMVHLPDQMAAAQLTDPDVDPSQVTVVLANSVAAPSAGNESCDEGPSTCLSTDGGNTNKSTRSDLVPGAQDFMMSYATLPGCVSYRHTELGSLYINKLNEKVRELHKSMPLDRILMKVTEQVRETVEKIPKLKDANFEDKQFPFYLPTTEKLIYLSIVAG